MYTVCGEAFGAIVFRSREAITVPIPPKRIRNPSRIPSAFFWCTSQLEIFVPQTRGPTSHNRFAHYLNSDGRKGTISLDRRDQKQIIKWFDGLNGRSRTWVVYTFLGRTSQAATAISRCAPSPPILSYQVTPDRVGAIYPALITKSPKCSPSSRSRAYLLIIG